AETVEEADEIGRRAVLDLASEDQTEGVDVVPGSDTGEDSDEAARTRRRLLDMARVAESLKGDNDGKLLEAVKHVKEFLKQGYRPILFCRFIPTAEYLAEELRKRLPKKVAVASVTGLIPPAEREARIHQLVQSPKRVLVCTECLSEGINLQDHFDAIMHYDLSWNPTRHEQREGRVDRFGQPKDVVRILTYYGIDNPIDGIVLDVLIRKHKKIRSSLGISVPVPVDTDAIVEAIFEGLLFREKSGATQQQLLPGLEEYLKPKKEDLYTRWDDAAEREKRSRTMFAQETLTKHADEVARVLEESQTAIGSPRDVISFTLGALREHGASIEPEGKKFRFDLGEVPRALRDAIGNREKFQAQFDLPVEEGTLYLNRTHSLVEGLAAYVMDTALDPECESIARRAGVIRTDAITRRTTLILARYRYDILARYKNEEKNQLAEECLLLAFEGSPAAAQWLEPEAAEALLQAEPITNIYDEQARTFVSRVVEQYDDLLPHLGEEAAHRAQVLLDAHSRVRVAARVTGVKYEVKPQLPPDILGIYIYLPATN
ncbi:MAG: helicase-related protein, partial [Candidatus Erginobacter occultus]|nr:helicase-related protein [Candidatus Erginobacter occultus]